MLDKIKIILLMFSFCVLFFPEGIDLLKFTVVLRGAARSEGVIYVDDAAIKVK